MIIKLNVDLHGKKAGALIEFEKLNYKDQAYWLRRIDDAKIDNCVEVMKSKAFKNTGRSKTLKNQDPA